MTQNFEIRRLEIFDLTQVTTVHMSAFPEGALSRLGRGAVSRYYRWQLDGPHDVAALGAFGPDELWGFCFGGVFRGALSGFLRRNRTYLGLQLLVRPWLALNPLILEHVRSAFHILARDRKAKVTASTPLLNALPSFGILSIAVSPALQRQGIGRMLMYESEQIARRKGFRVMHLTVHVEDHKSIRFYEQLGWEKIVGTIGWQGHMVKKLNGWGR